MGQSRKKSPGHNCCGIKSFHDDKQTGAEFLRCCIVFTYEFTCQQFEQSEIWMGPGE